MKTKTQWQVRGRAAERQEIAEVLALGRQHKKRVADADREARERDRDARAVGAALRRGSMERDHVITCRPAPVRGSRKSSTRLRGFEVRLGLLVPKRSYVSADGFSSFHLKFTPRGLGSHRRAKDRPFRSGEAVVAVRYILRDAAREIDGGGLVSNIGRDADTIASFFAALEELEHTGRANGNVYTGIIVSPPHELDGPGREALLQEICRLLGDLGLPYAAILHAPDPEGNPLNYHAHVMFSWRPATVLPDGFSFATNTLGSLNQREFVIDFRAHAAAAMNKAMLAAGHQRRFTAKQRDRKDADISQDKLGAGRKHADRRRENIALGKAEKAWVDERLGVLALARSVLQDVLLLDTVNHSASLAALDQREAELVQEHRKIAEASHVPTFQIEMTPSLVSHEKPTASVMQPSKAGPAREQQTDCPKKPATLPPALSADVVIPNERAIERARHAWRAQLFASSPTTGLRDNNAKSLSSVEALSNIPGLGKALALRDAPSPGVILRGDTLPATAIVATTPSSTPISGRAESDVPSVGSDATSSPVLSVRTSVTKPSPDHLREPVSNETLETPGRLGGDEFDAIIAHLSAMSFLPLRSIESDKGRTKASTFELVFEVASPEDVDALRQAAALDDERLARLYNERWAAMLERLRALLMNERTTVLHAKLTDGLKRGDARAATVLEAQGWDPQLVAAIRAAGKSREIVAIVEESERYWRERAMSRLPAARTSGGLDALRAEARGRASKQQAADERAPDTALDILAAHVKGGGQDR